MTEAVITADGTPLKQSLQRSLRREKLRALLLVAPLFLFIAITFFAPIFNMLLRSVENDLVPDVLQQSAPLIEQWDEQGGELPGEEIFAALKADFDTAKANKTIMKVGRRLNYEQSGTLKTFRITVRKLGKMEAPYKEAFIQANEKWGEFDIWRIIKREIGPLTGSYYVAAVDMGYDDAGSLVRNDNKSRIYVKLYWRTAWMSLLITFLCLILAYPIAYYLSIIPVRQSNMLLILVLLPFWTSLLVRTTSWIALLQKEGVINDFLVALGLLSTDDRLQMIHNRAGTIIAMTHILLPFMVLPLFSVMKTIPPSYMRAARSLGANPFTAFVKVYMPNTVAGMGAGGILVFILAIGYYITPALVGGQSGSLISNQIAYHISSSLNWGLAAALGALLLSLVLALYFLYDRIVGIDNMKLG